MLEHDERVAVVVALATALLTVVLAVVVALLADASASRPAVGGASSATCMEWSDGCVICARGPEGIACSTPGIACTRAAHRCLRP